MYGRFCIKFPQSRMKGERHILALPFNDFQLPVPVSGQFLVLINRSQFFQSVNETYMCLIFVNVV
jgi:hypothetical protein